MSLQTAWTNYRGTCECGNSNGYRNNCAHYLSDALIRAGYNEIDGGKGEETRIVNGFCVCSAGRPLRAKEMRDWFARKFSKHSELSAGLNVVYQERSRDRQGHVLIKNGTTGEHRGTGDFPEWNQQYYH